MTDRRSRWFPSGSELETWVSSRETDFLYEDFHDQIIPYRDNPEAYELSATGVPAHQVIAALSLGDRAWQLDDFLRAVASRLLTHHEVWLEVTFDEGNDNCTPFQVYEVDGVKRTREGNLIQQLPSLDELPDWDPGDDEWKPEVELDADRMVYVPLPDAYPSQTLKQVVGDLADVSPDVMPDWAMNQWDDPPFDIGEFARTQRLRILQAALPIGWTARENLRYPHSNVSDYYHLWRELRFLHFCASMRERAEDALRQVFTLASERCGLLASVTSHGLHTPRAVEELMRKFKAGDLALSTVEDLVRERVNDTRSEQRRMVFEVRPSGGNGVG